MFPPQHRQNHHGDEILQLATAQFKPHYKATRFTEEERQRQIRARTRRKAAEGLTLRNTRSWRNSQGLSVTRAALNLTDINSMGCSLQQRSGTEHLVSYSLESAETVKSGKQHLLQVFATVNEPQVYSRRFQCRKHRICCLPNAQYTVYLYIYFCFCSTK